MTESSFEAARKRLRRRLRIPHLSVTNRQSWAVALGVLLAQTADVEFVGSSILDVGWKGLVAGLGAYVASTAKRGPLLVAALAAVVTSQSLYAVVIALVAVVAGALSTVKIHRRAVFYRGLCGGTAVTSLLVSAEDRVSWFTAITAVVVVTPIVRSGLRNTSARIRKVLLWSGGAALAFGIAATGLVGLSVYEQTGNADLAAAELEFGLAAARLGDTALAYEHLQAASALASSAEHSISRFGLPARIVPFVAQHVDALTGVLDRSARVADQAAITAGIADEDGLAVVNGQIDPAAIAALANPLRRLATDLDSLDAELDDQADAPLVPALGDRLADLAAPVAKARREAMVGADAAEVMPDALGANGARRYLVLFTSPAEARGRFGFPGSFAEVTLTDGRLLLGEQGATSEVFVQEDPTQGAFDVSSPQLAPYLGYGPTASILSSTIPPDFQTVARVVAQHWEQSGRAPLDGVLRFDPASLAGLLQWTGPVVVRDVPEPISAANVEQFLLFDQYVQFQASNAPRREVLDTVADVTFERLVTAELPPPRQLADVFGPLARAGHFDVALFRSGSDDLVRRAGVAGEFTAPRSDGVVVSTINSGGNKIDTFLDTSVRYRAEVDDGRLDGTLQVHLDNAAPATGLPRYVVGSSTTPPLPSGTNRLTLLIWTQVEPLRATVNGTERPVRTFAADDRWLVQVPLDIPPGGVADVELVLGGAVPLVGDEYQLRLEPGGTVRPTTYDVSIRTGDGQDLVFTDRVRSPRTVR